ncbi:unannotated protein [freshwater metagenome]|uniref:Unannotated protein n=1 Tax=freshwater metagenome TaxID=449393 RepID=A0A6J6GPX2_9ZZZZ|nr:hypothetical protein [Actinomycetota bacterium]
MRIAFLGDSITHSGSWQDWLPGHQVTNFAQPGHTTFDMANLFEEVRTVDPELIIVMIGTNDFGGQRLPEEQVVHNILDNANNLRELFPVVPIIWNSLSPRSDEYSQKIVTTNKKIKPALENLRIEYLDVFSLLKESGSIIIERRYCADPDSFGLHLNQSGYEVWLKALEPLIYKFA